MRKSIMLYRNQKGQSFVEFALVLPILLVLVMGVIQFGLILGGNIAVSSAAREGARVAARDNLLDNSDLIKDKVIEAAATYRLLEPVEYNDINVEVESETITINGSELEVDSISISVNGRVRIIVPFLDDILGNNTVDGFFIVRASNVMKDE